MNQSVFYPDHLTRQIRHNAENAEWAQAACRSIVTTAQPWADCPDRLLWNAMFSPDLKRSWMVWSSGHCPSCKDDVAMYGWEIDPASHPWKVKCPHCEELFPKNDFQAYYKSGIDEHGVFQREGADPELLGTSESDVDQNFGIDDGNGYTDGENTWMFIATYLIYGQWKQFIHGGIMHLADAYTVTGKAAYARKAGILLDRVADLYPDFDFAKQGWLYERTPDFGYVTNWHDACKEVRQMANAYDQVKPALLEDAAFLEFVQSQSQRYKLRFRKDTIQDVIDHIENRIFRDTQKNVHKIKSNFPGQEIALITMEAVLQGTLETEPIQGMLDAMLSEAVAVDGVTGEKGLENYSAGVLQTLADFLAELERMSPGFLAEQLKRHPDLARTYRFHIDTWCLEKFYPSIGDSGTFASEAQEYRGLPFVRDISLQPSAFRLAYTLFELTGDPDFVRVLYRANDNETDGLPYDLSETDPEAFQANIREAITTHGEALTTGSINFEDWHLAILRSGEGAHERAFWMSYDTGLRHGHMNGLSIGLFSRGLDLLPDFGYLPVHRGGWYGPHVDWYKGTAAHNTVLVDGKNQESPVAGETHVWRLDANVQVIKASAPAMYDVPRYERTCAMVEIDAEHFYIVDVFDVEGGQDHTYFLRGPESSMSTNGLALTPAETFGHGTQMQNHLLAKDAAPGWSATWRHADAPVSIRYTGLSESTSVGTAESWVSQGKWTYDDLWIPTVMVRNQSSESLTSRFIGLIDVFGDQPAVTSVVRNTKEGECVLEVGLASGGSHTVVLNDEGIKIEL